MIRLPRALRRSRHGDNAIVAVVAVIVAVVVVSGGGGNRSKGEVMPDGVASASEHDPPTKG